MPVEIQIDKSRFDPRAVDIPQNRITAAEFRALNRTATGVRAEASRQLRKTVRLKASKIKDGVFLDRADRSSLTARIRFSGKPIGLIHFGARQTKLGVSASVLKSSKRSILKHAFIPRGLATNVFERDIDKPRKPRKWGESDLPIKKLFGPSLASVVEGRNLEGLSRYTLDRLAREVAHELDRELVKLGWK